MNTPPLPINPDCREDKHSTCPGVAWGPNWDVPLDSPLPCGCQCHTTPEGLTVIKSAKTFPCTGRPHCGGTARLTFEPGHFESEGEFVGDRAIYVCDNCGLLWGEDGRPLPHYRIQGDAS